MASTIIAIDAAASTSQGFVDRFDTFRADLDDYNDRRERLIKVYAYSQRFKSRLIPSQGQP